MLWLGHVLFWLVVHLPRISNIYALCGERQFVKIVRARHIKASKFILVASLSTHNPPTKRGISIFKHRIWDPETSNYPNSDNSTWICFFIKLWEDDLGFLAKKGIGAKNVDVGRLKCRNALSSSNSLHHLAKLKFTSVRPSKKSRRSLEKKKANLIRPPLKYMWREKKILKNKCWMKPGLVH